MISKVQGLMVKSFLFLNKLEALESLLSSVSIFGGPTHESLTRISTDDLPAELTKLPIHENSLNWMLEKTSFHVISYGKLYLALQYMSTLMREHPSCLDNDRPSFKEIRRNLEVDRQDFEKSLKEFEGRMTDAIAYLQQKFSLVPLHLLSMVIIVDLNKCILIYIWGYLNFVVFLAQIVLSLYHNGLEFIGHNILQDYAPKFMSQEKSNGPDDLFWFPANWLKATEEMFSLYVKYVLTSCKNCTRSTYLAQDSLASEGRLCWLAAWSFSNQGILRAFKYLRAMLQLFLGSRAVDSQKLLLFILGLFEYHILFASSWLLKNSKAIIVTIGPILSNLLEGSDSFELKAEELNKLITEIVEILGHDLLCVELGPHAEITGQKQEPTAAVPDTKAWHIMSAAFWVHLSKFLEHLSSLPEVPDEISPSQSFPVLELNGNNLQQRARLASSTLVEFLRLTCSAISYNSSKQFAIYLLQEVNILNRNYLSCFEDGLSQPRGGNNNQMSEYAKLLDNGNGLPDFEKLRHICASPRILCGAFQDVYTNWLPYFKQNSSSGWNHAYTSITAELGSEETWDKEDGFGSPRAIGSPLACLSPDHPFKTSGDNDTCDSKRVMPFQNPKEIYRRNGELLEVPLVPYYGPNGSIIAYELYMSSNLL